MHVKRSRRRFCEDTNGVTAIEFAIIAPVVLLLLSGIIEVALIMMVSTVMEGATAISSRLGKTGFSAPGLTREQTIRTAITNRAGSLVKPELLGVASKFYKQYDQINDPEPFIDSNGNGNRDSNESYTDVNGNGRWDVDMGASGYGSAGDVVVYTVTYPWAIATPIISNLVGENGNYIITTHAVVKNEPY